MPFQPSDLAWWAWLLCAVGFWIAANTVTSWADRSGNWFARLLSWTCAAGMVLCLVLALIRFVKWVWQG